MNDTYNMEQFGSNSPLRFFLEKTDLDTAPNRFFADRNHIECNCFYLNSLHVTRCIDVTIKMSMSVELMMCYIEYDLIRFMSGIVAVCIIVPSKSV